MTTDFRNEGWENFRQKHHEARCLLRQACDRYHPEAIFLFFSGGYDSLAATNVAYSTVLNHTVGLWPGLGSQPTIKVIHVNTGIGIEETRQYARNMAMWQSWPLAEYATPVKYEDIVKKHGFPGPDAHRYLYIQLKERAIDRLVHDHTLQRKDWRSFMAPILKQSLAMPLQYRTYLYAALMELYPLFMRATRNRVLFVTGVRKQESSRRMGHVKAFQEEGRRVWVAPLIDWTKDDILNHVEFNQLPRNRVVDALHMSGECLCGSYAHKGELDELCFWYPATGQYIKELEKIVQGEGFVWGWEEAPPCWWNQMKHGQEFLPGFSPLCSSCDARNAAR